MPKVRFLVVDDHPIFRHGLTALLQSDPRYVVAAEAGSVPEALEALERETPDAALVDLSLGGPGGLGLLKILKETYPTIRVLVVSIYDEAVYADRVLKAGAKGYLMKQAASSALKEAVRTILSGKVYLSAEYRNLLLERIGEPENPETRPATTRLTDRELEVLEELGRGYGITEIAERLHLSGKTVGVYQDHIKKKLGVESASELRRYAIGRLQNQDF